jgi:hypothetical protein
MVARHIYKTYAENLEKRLKNVYPEKVKVKT